MATKTHVTLPGSKRGKDRDATEVGEVDPKEPVVVTIALAGPKLPGPDEYVGQTLTSEELSEKFGASKDDADKVAKSLKKYGLKVEDVSLESRSMRISGTAAAMESAFKPGMVMMRSARVGDYRGRRGTLQIPADLKGIVKGVFGLDERRMAKRKAAKPASASHTATMSPLTPADLEQRYNFPPGDEPGKALRLRNSAAVISPTTQRHTATSFNARCRPSKRSLSMLPPIRCSRSSRFLLNSDPQNWTTASR